VVCSWIRVSLEKCHVGSCPGLCDCRQPFTVEFPDLQTTQVRTAKYHSLSSFRIYKTTQVKNAKYHSLSCFRIYRPHRYKLLSTIYCRVFGFTDYTGENC